MCSVFGIIGDYDEKRAFDALSAMRHRGPDFCGVVKEKNLFFAHQRLSILDISASSNQPFRYKDILVSFNGEIYNYKELKNQLNYEFKSDGDGEVIIASYLKWGVDFVKHLRGMFAIALMDGDTLYLFRDRLGKKPLFYYGDSRSFIFASELKGIVPFLKQTRLNYDALFSYLSFLAPTPPFTFFDGVKKVASSEYLIYKDGKAQLKRYFDPLDASPNIITNKDEALYLIEEKLKESIKLRLDAHTPMASLLSGGIDSATINFYAKQNSKNLQTYTLGYDGYSKYDERQNAKESAEFLGLQNKEVVIDKDRFLDASEAVIDGLDEPLNDPASVPLYLLFEQIKKDGFRVVLSGEGSDELFMGYRQYFEYLDIERLSNLKNKGWLKNYFRSNFSNKREWEWYKRIFENTTLFRTSGECFSDLQQNNLLKRNIKDNNSLKYLKPYIDRFANSTHTDKATWYSYIDLNLFQAEHFLAKLDRVSMAHSIESRTPFLDHELASLLFSIDPKLKYEDGVTKSLLKKIMKNRLNAKILKRKKKGFSNPYMEYLVDANKLQIIKEVNEKTGLFRDDELENYLASAKQGNFKQHIWGLYTLSVWMKKYLL
ncbi:MAG: asparagine synthase (glutamine-hydrolyzing) [Campylobacterales bacterium]|nr:asparagine synthase (glutamine-hydrolyzing) [Campylobacterales bacterium]